MKLHPEQEYVLRHAQELAITPSPIFKTYQQATTGEEKRVILGGSAQIVCALYFSRRGEYFGVVTAKPRVSQRDALQMGFGISRSQGKKYSLGQGYPLGMGPHVCTPFPRREIVGELVRGIIIDQALDEMAKIDISMGITSDDFDLETLTAAQRTSMHLPGSAVYPILAREFGDEYVKKLSLS